MTISRLLTLFTLVAALTACSMFGEEEDKTKGWSAQKLYAEASGALANSNYAEAIKYYEKLEARYPFGRYAMQAQLDVAYAYYKDEEPDKAIVAADRFIKLYPNSPATPYAYYLKGIVNFNQGIGLLERYLPTDPSQRDAGAAVEAYKSFDELVRKYPESEYAKDARQRMIYLRNNLARYEVHVARYYYNRGAYVAAVNRAAYVIEKYQRSPAARDALELMAAAYDKLELPALASDARRVLAANEQRGSFAPDPVKSDEKTWSRSLWDYLELDQN
jgi:outer membrane protein assembly factor BamD